MGFVKQVVSKITGADQEADAIERNAQNQAAATRAAAEQAANATAEATKQSAKQAASLAANSAARSAALSSSEEAVAKPPESPVVEIGATPSSNKKRREKFGVGYSSTGVNI